MDSSPLFMELSRQEYWSGFPLPSPGDLPNPGIESVPPALTGRFFTTGTTWEAWRMPSFSTNQCPIRHPKSMGGNKYNGCRNCLSHLHGEWTLSKGAISPHPLPPPPSPKSWLNLLQYFFCFLFWFFGCKACGKSPEQEDRSGLTEARRRGAGQQPWRRLMAGCSIAPRT